MSAINHLCLKLILASFAIINTITALTNDGTGHLEFLLQHEEEMYYSNNLRYRYTVPKSDSVV